MFSSRDSAQSTHHVCREKCGDEGLVRQVENPEGVLQDVDIAKVNLTGMYIDNWAFSDAL